MASDSQRRIAELTRFVMSETIGPEFLATLKKVSDALAGSSHALIGGQAVFFRGYRRFSKDIDIGVGGSVRDTVRALVGAGLRSVEGARLVDPETKVQVD